MMESGPQTHRTEPVPWRTQAATGKPDLETWKAWLTCKLQCWELWWRRWHTDKTKNESQCQDKHQKRKRRGRREGGERKGSRIKAWASEASWTRALVWRWKSFPNTTLQSLHATFLNYKESNELLKLKSLDKACHCKTKVKNIHYM